MISEALRRRVAKIAAERVKARARGEPLPSLAFVAREIVNVEPVTSRYRLKDVEKAGTKEL